MMNSMIDCLISSILSFLFLLVLSHLFTGWVFENTYENFFGLTVFVWFSIIEWRIHELGSRKLT